MESQNREKISGEIRIPPLLVKEVEEDVNTVARLKAKLEAKEHGYMSSFLGLLLTSSTLLDASDLHAEPEKEHTKIRLRIDGVLQDVGKIPLSLYQELLSRIKLISGIKLNVTDRPQDGRFSLFLEGSPLEVRTSTLPAEYGESVVLRILNPKNLITLGELGLTPELQKIFEKEIQKPNGMIIVTGPTGSGKTTTLYAFLREVQNPEIKIITIEDPIEYHVEGISQTQVDPAKGYDFASGLRAIVRQDPDVILVGEIRDGQTADIALQAALTGHLVFSTLHTNDAAGTVSRLTSLGMQPATIASALTLIVAQRLVRKICKKCAQFVVPTAEQKKIIQQKLGALVGHKEFKIPIAKGCEVCNGTGFRGRVGIFEAIVVDDRMEEFILTSPSIATLKNFAIKRGMVTMYQDGLRKIIEGVTTLQEVERVTSEQ